MKVTLSPVVESGLFLVLKKESSLRTIWDARKANRYVRRPLVAQMVIDEGFSKSEMDAVEPGHRWFMASTPSIVCLFRQISAAATHFHLSLQKNRGNFLVVASKQERSFLCELVSPFPAGSCIFVRTQRFALLQGQASRVASKFFQIDDLLSCLTFRARTAATD